jgi:hypothetical protein
MRTIAALALSSVLVLTACSAARSTRSGEPSGVPSTSESSTPSAVPASPSAAEVTLLAGARTDLQGRCVPLRTDLIESALAGVVCTPASEVIGQVNLYLFDTEHDLMTAYLSWLATHGIAVRSGGGRCLAGRPSEGAYTPGDGGAVLLPVRGGCYVDETGLAHYAATAMPFVLIELDGKVGDSTAVERFAWLGNQDIPGGPTAWRADGPSGTEK